MDAIALTRRDSGAVHVAVQSPIPPVSVA
jgi:hypothetical protein